MFGQLILNSLITLSSGLFLVTLQNAAVAVTSDTLDNGTVSTAATVTFQQNSNFLSNLRIQISRNQQAVTSAAIPVQQLPNYNRRVGFRANTTDVIVLDLDSDGEPEVITDVAEAKNNCCSSSFIYTYNPQLKQYSVKTQFWGNYNSGYWLVPISGEERDKPPASGKADRKLADVDNDGFYEFAAYDDRFRTRFSSIGGLGGSYAPIRIWRYQQGKMNNVTKEFPYFLTLNAMESLDAYERIRSQSGAEAAKSAMAAYVGAMCLLGQKDEAIQQLQQGYGDTTSGQRFITQLTSFLKQAGYGL
ncbi:MAG: hypothetical protein MUD14_15565 [Hydrococcus sp. Prado102]|jgi:hypothetical protein|nr:hypothetical protein [Hydrococcus sp. Prado102]